MLNCNIRLSKSILEPIHLNVLFVCSGNSGRSIMAETILRAIGRGRFNVFSAGSRPTGRVNPRTIMELRQRGYRVDGLQSKSWQTFSSLQAPELDYVITVCSNIAGDRHPVWPGNPTLLTWPLAPPGQAEGTDEQVQAAFSEVCDQIEARVQTFVLKKEVTLEEKRAHSRKLMHEVASISNSAGSTWVPVVLLDVSLSGISFASAEVLSSDGTYSMRFTLPGAARLHFASVTLTPRTTSGVPSGYRYGARFLTIDRQTLDHVIQFMSEPA